MARSIFYCLHCALSLLCLMQPIVVKSQESGPAIPTLPNYFSTYSETISDFSSDLNTTVVISRYFYNLDVNLTRTDFVAQLIDSSSSGTISVIEDTNVGVMYIIYRQYSNCTITPLDQTSDVFLGKDGKYHLRSPGSIYLLSVVNYTYIGNTSAHGVFLDNWMFTGNFSHAGTDYINCTIQWSITQPGQAIPSLSSLNTSPIPWRMSLKGTANIPSINESIDISTVTRLFDLTLEEPSFDVFDVSICVDPKDVVMLTLAIPGIENGTDLSKLRGNIRKAISNYTKIYPIQVGNVEIISENGSFIFATLQISNLTSIANVTDSISADEAYNTIIDDTVDGLAPFQIETMPGVIVTPYILSLDATQNCSNVSTVTSTTTIFITASTTIPTHTPEPVIITTTATITVTPTISCPLVPSPTTDSTCPPNTGSSEVGVPQSRVVGVAFGTLFTGIFIACISMVICFVCYQKTRTRMWSLSTTDGYQRQPDTVIDKDYFQ